MRLNLSTLWRRRLRPAHERHDLDAPKHLRQARLGVALSAGGAKGLAHVGVLQVLEEHGIEIHAVAGSSMGAYVGALWACGFSGSDLVELAEEMHDSRQIRKLADPIIPPLTGIIRGMRAKRHLMRSIGETRFEDLNRRLLISTFDLDTKERLVLRQGMIAEAVHASCAMPGIIAPVTLHGHRCADGGVVDPLPVGSLRKFGDIDVILAVNVQPTLEEIDRHLSARALAEQHRATVLRRLGSCLNRSFNLAAPGNIIDTMRKAVKAAQLRLAEEASKRADLCLHPSFEGPGYWHDYHNFEYYIAAGREIALAHLDELKMLLSPERDHESSPQAMVGKRVA